MIFFDIDETIIHCLDDRDPPDMRNDVSLVVNLANRFVDEAKGQQPN